MDKKKKLKKIFKLIFNSIKPKNISSANTKSIKDWDSINHLKLKILIEDTFNIQIKDFSKMTSFQKILDYLNNK